MERADWLTEQFESARPRLHAVAYRMLGSHLEADDAVQEAWVKVARAGTDGVENLAGWLTTIVSRVCLDKLRTRRSSKEDIVDDVPVVVRDDHGPEYETLLSESVGIAMLIVLDRLPPAERVAFVLHDVFAVPFDDIARIVDRSPEATRQLASRARRRVQGTPATAAVDVARQREIVDAFHAAARHGDLDTLLALLDPDVALRPDATAVSLGAAGERRGAAEVATVLSHGLRAARRAVVGGAAGLAWAPGGRVRGAIEFTIVDGRIAAIDLVGDRDRLDRLDVVLVA